MSPGPVSGATRASDGTYPPVNSAPPGFDPARDLPPGLLDFLTPLHREFTPEELLTLVSTHAKYEEKPGMAEAEIIKRRKNVVTFLIQCGHYDQAEREYKRLVKDFPGQEAAGPPVRLDYRFPFCSYSVLGVLTPSGLV